MLANTAYLGAERVTICLVFLRGCALDLTKYLVPLVLQHVDLALFSRQLVPHACLNVRDLLDEKAYIFTHLLFLQVIL